MLGYVTKTKLGGGGGWGFLGPECFRDRISGPFCRDFLDVLI